MSRHLDDTLSTIDRALGDAPDPAPEQWINVNAESTTFCPRTRDEADAAAIASRVGVMHVDGWGNVTYYRLDPQSSFGFVPVALVEPTQPTS